MLASSDMRTRPVFDVEILQTGGLSNREKDKRKAMPLGAVRSKVARNKQWKKSKGSGKNQFRGKKAWK